MVQVLGEDDNILRLAEDLGDLLERDPASFGQDEEVETAAEEGDADEDEVEAPTCPRRN